MSVSMFNTLMKYEIPEDKGSHVKVDTHTWHGAVIDTYQMDAEKPYLQMVGYFITADGEDILLCRKDIPMLDIEDLDFFNARREFFCQLIRWSFHGFADKLHYEISIDDLIASRAVIQPFCPANNYRHETIYLEDSIELGGKTVYWKVTSEKLTNGPFKQTIDFFVKNYDNIGRHFIIDVEAASPFVKISDHYEWHKAMIAETLGLNLSKP